MEIRALYDSIFDADGATVNKQRAIETFENNREFILSEDKGDHEDNHFYTTLFVSQYAHVLVQQENFTKALPFLERAISLWDNVAVYEFFGLRKSWQETLFFDRGVSNYNLNRISGSVKDFSWLNKHYPSNGEYTNWLVLANARSLKRTEKLLVPLTVVLVIAFVLILAVQKYYSTKSAELIDIPMGVITVSSVIAVLIVGRKRKKVSALLPRPGREGS